MGSTFNLHTDTDPCAGQTGGPPALRLPCVQDQATRSHLHSDWLGSPPDFRKVGREPDYIVFGRVKASTPIFRSHLRLDFHTEDQEQAVQVGSRWSWASSPNIRSQLFDQ